MISASSTPAKTSRIGSILFLKCPGCSRESMFENPKVYTWTNMGQVKDTCSNCGTNLKPEIGFYFGAAYANWAITVALWVSVLIVLKVLNQIQLIEFGFLTHPKTFLLTGIACTIVLFPYLYRVSRSIWAHIHIKRVAK